MKTTEVTGCSMVCAGNVASASCLFSNTPATLPRISLPSLNAPNPLKTASVIESFILIARIDH